MKSDIMVLLVFFMMGFNLCIPVIQKQFTVEEMSVATVKAEPLGDATLIDSYSEANQDTDLDMKSLHPSDLAYASAVGQSFTCGGAYKITSAKFYMKCKPFPTGMAHAVLYAHSGTYGTDSVSTGEPLATSDDFDVSTLTIGYQLITFTFTGAQQYVMSADTKYCIVYVNPTSGTINPNDYPIVGWDGSSPTHDGNLFYWANSGWIAYAGGDTCFYVYGEAVAPANNIPTSSDEAPTNSTDCVDWVGGGIRTYAVVTDADSDDMNATWWSNSSGSWKQYGVANTSISTGTNISQLNVNFSVDDTWYHWWLIGSDGMGGSFNDSYSFKICANVTTLDIWNITLGNTTQPYILDTWIITLENTTISPYVLDTWNITLGNLTISPYVLDTWIITLGNTSQPYILDTWIITLENTTISPYTLDIWNITLGNLTISPLTLDIWIITLENTTISPYVLDTWNITLSALELIPRLSCVFIYSVSGSVITVIPTIIEATRYKWTVDDNIETEWIPIDDIYNHQFVLFEEGNYLITLTAEDGTGASVTYIKKVTVAISVAEEPEPPEIVEEEEKYKMRNVFEGISDWFGQRSIGELIFIGIIGFCIFLMLLRKRPKKSVIYPVIKK